MSLSQIDSMKLFHIVGKPFYEIFSMLSENIRKLSEIVSMKLSQIAGMKLS